MKISEKIPTMEHERTISSFRGYKLYSQSQQFKSTAEFVNFLLGSQSFAFRDYTKKKYEKYDISKYEIPKTKYEALRISSKLVLSSIPCSPGSHEQESVLFTANGIKLTEINVPELFRIWERSGEADLANGPGYRAAVPLNFSFSLLSSAVVVTFSLYRFVFQILVTLQWVCSRIPCDPSSP